MDVEHDTRTLQSIYVLSYTNNASGPLWNICGCWVLPILPTRLDSGRYLRADLNCSHSTTGQRIPDFVVAVTVDRTQGFTAGLCNRVAVSGGPISLLLTLILQVLI